MSAVCKTCDMELFHDGTCPMCQLTELMTQIAQFQMLLWKAGQKALLVEQERDILSEFYDYCNGVLGGEERDEGDIKLISQAFDQTTDKLNTLLEPEEE